MRWDALFDDLETQLEAQDRLALDAEIDELTRLEQSAQQFTDRLRAHCGAALLVRTVHGPTVAGTLSHVGSDWLVLDAGPAQYLVPLAMVGSVEGLGRGSLAEPSEGRRRLGMATALRALCRDRNPVALHLSGAAPLAGVIDRVGRDYLELAVLPAGESRRPRTAVPVHAVPFRAIVLLGSQR